jgi:UDP-2-acetamido-2-deoxy-ribo-hexuluronate aminotransferase
MREIQMVDLKTQYLKIKTQVDRSIIEVVESGAFINGPAVKEFQKNLAVYLNCKHALGCGNGTDALQIALMALGLKPGDEVITTPFTFVATAEVIALLGLKIVFVDADPETFNIDVTKLEAAITPKTRCIIPVHLFGQPCDMQAIKDIAAKHSLSIVEDNAQAVSAECKVDGKMQRTGTIGDVGTLSFYPSKNLSCFGDGGAFTTNDDALFARIKQISNHGADRKYYHDSIGVNSRLDTVQAAVLNIKLENLDAYTEARRKAAAYYDKGLAGVENVTIPYRAPYATHVFHQYTLKVKDREALAEYLISKGIPTMIYYPVPLHLQGAYLDGKYPEGSMPVSEQLSKEVLSLPMHTELDEEQQDLIINTIKNFYSQR